MFLFACFVLGLNRLFLEQFLVHNSIEWKAHRLPTDPHICTDSPPFQNPTPEWYICYKLMNLNILTLHYHPKSIVNISHLLWVDQRHWDAASCVGEHRVFLLVQTATLCREYDPALGLFCGIVDTILLLQLLVLHINN